MGWTRARGIASRSAAILGATLLIAALAPFPTAAAGHQTYFGAPTRKIEASRTKVDVSVAARRPLRVTPASARLQAKARPAGLRPAASTVRLRAARAARPNVAVLPPLVSTHQFTTTTGNDTGVEPPDPWVTDNGSYLVSSTNSAVRISNRNGVALATVPTYAMFGTPSTHWDSDPRILWDAAHGRWIGVVVAYDNPAYADTSLEVTVSDTSNPLGTWTVHTFAYGAHMPDFPGIASSTDKVVLTANLFLGGSAYEGTAYLAVSWASLLSGATVAGAEATCADPCWNVRPARQASPSADIHMVYEAPDGFVHDMLLTGPAATVQQQWDVSLGIADGVVNLDHAPRQPGDADGIADASGNNAVDSRIPDAVWWNGSLYFARTGQYAWDGTNNDLTAEEYVVSTSSLPGTVTIAAANRFGNTATDYFIPGVGISTGGDFFLTYTTSSATQTPALVAHGSLDGVTYTDGLTVATSPASYGGTRWGDFMGISSDPAGSSAVWQANEVATASGDWQEVVSRLVLDGTPPAAAPGTPVQSLVRGSQLGTSTVPIKVSWSPTADAGSGIAQYALQDVYDAVRTTATSVTRLHPWVAYGTPGNHGDQFQVQGYDDAGNASPWSAASAPLTPTVFQQTARGYTWSVGWTSRSSSAYSGGSAKYATRAGRYVSFRMSGRSFAWVSYKASSRGRAKVYVDGVYRGLVTLTASKASARSLVYAVTFAASGIHTIKVMVYSGRVDVDGFVVLR